MRSSHYRPTSRFNYRARCPARSLNWRSIRNNYTLLDMALPWFPPLMAWTKGARPACLSIIKHRTTQQRPRLTFLSGRSSA